MLKRIRSIKLMVLMVLGASSILTLGGVSPASAYLDPASGSMISQLILGGVAGIAVVIKLYWQSLKDRIYRLLRVGRK